MFEVIYHWREEGLVSGEYEGEVKTKTVKIGAGYDDVSLEVLAGKIIAQLARRNILIVDVEIYEFEKKKLTYKQTPDGILIKNRKFKFDDGPVLMSEAEPAADLKNQLVALLTANPNLLNQLKVQPNGNQPNYANPSTSSAPIRYEIFDPNDLHLIEAKNKRYALTPGKKYPIVREKHVGSKDFGWVAYTVIDDNGKELADVDAKYWTSPTAGRLTFDDAPLAKPMGGSSAGLLYNDMMGESTPDGLGMPKLR